jgi:hypothetical protein
VPALLDRGVGHPAACHFATVRPVLAPVRMANSRALEEQREL